MMINRNDTTGFVDREAAVQTGKRYGVCEGEKINESRTAGVFEFGDNRALKLIRETVSLEVHNGNIKMAGWLQGFFPECRRFMENWRPKAGLVLYLSAFTVKR